jgi:hemerythrin-like metal-binding protein
MSQVEERLVTMSLITWSDKYSVGVEEIDTQHKKLIQLINGLHDHMIAGDAKDIMGKVLDRIIEYTGFHFGTEERLMSEFAYPQSPAHLHEHKKLVDTAVDLQNKFRSGKAQITMETSIFLRDWLQNHILETDKLFGAYLNSQGVE